MEVECGKNYTHVVKRSAFPECLMGLLPSPCEFMKSSTQTCSCSVAIPEFLPKHASHQISGKMGEELSTTILGGDLAEAGFFFSLIFGEK